ncbi:selenide, water dikinase SelD [Thermohalobacter berrensis]|uniref:Selenide, water dikinase n=1 Tax=Thermohalobacter berrensis TaxID=99594 RepID=A0A419T4X0_9FIRM|nr:selenide, water dikinase SelD [Thermohalobacter berrensis]
MGPETLAQVLCQIPKMEDKNLLVGIDTSDDAAVYKINDNTALIQTVDFFTPVVDDPYTFGQIAAANSLSDIYAMGGEPKLAMNIICFPNCLSLNIMAEILKGGYDKVKESGALLVGGHTVEDEEPKYGLSVSGFIHPEKILTNNNAQVGDLLVLTKPIGLGIINTAIKADMIDDETYNKAVDVMRTLNKTPKDAMIKVGVNACTDVTGFGLLGHTLEMAEGSNVTIKLYVSKIPMIKKALKLAEMGLVPAGAYSNMSFVGDKVYFSDEIPQNKQDILFDPQTSGGLLISVSNDKADELLRELKDNPFEYAIIGEVIEKGEHPIIVKK